MQSVPYPTPEPVAVAEAKSKRKSSGALSGGCTSGRCYFICCIHVHCTASFSHLSGWFIELILKLCVVHKHKAVPVGARAHQIKEMLPIIRCLVGHYT
jgi:hypothetical protein